MATHQQQRRQRGRRPVQTRLQAELVLFAVEGKTEKEYLTALQKERYDHRLAFQQIASLNKTSLRNLVEAARKAEKGNRNRHIWIVCDTDENAAHRDLLHEWLEVSERHHVALTHPSIEYWILQHYCDAGAPQTAHDAVRKLREYVPKYKKGMTFSDAVLKSVDAACDRENRRRPNGDEHELWDRCAGTTCHKMIAFLDDLARDHERRERELSEGK